MKYGISDITFVKLKHRLTRDFFLGKKVKKKKLGAFLDLRSGVLLLSSC